MTTVTQLAIHTGTFLKIVPPAYASGGLCDEDFETST